MTTNTTTNIILVHGAWSDGYIWSKVIPILKNEGHRVIVVQLPLHSLADDVATVKRAIDLVGPPTILVGHSYGGFVITNAGYNNSNVMGLVYVAGIAPDEGESISNFIDPAKLPPGFLIFDSRRFAYLNPEIFSQAFAQELILLKLISWPLCKSQLMNQLLLNHLALRLGSNFRPGIRYLRPTGLFLLISNANSHSG